MITVRQIPDFPKYAASRDGRIFSFTAKSKGAELKQCTTAKGYKFICIYNKGVRHLRFVHRLVLETYIGYCPRGFQCRHLNGNKEDNRLSNLCWGTPSDNIKDKLKHNKKYNQGATHPQTKLTEEDIKLIIHSFNDGCYSGWDLATHFGLSKSAISKIVHRRTWRNVCL